MNDLAFILPLLPPFLSLGDMRLLSLLLTALSLPGRALGHNKALPTRYPQRILQQPLR